LATVSRFAQNEPSLFSSMPFWKIDNQNAIPG
jgi:hypothetical protein